MPRIEPIPWEDLTPEQRAFMDDGGETGAYTMTVPLQILAYRDHAEVPDDGDRHPNFPTHLLGGRLLELLRIRSGQLGGCEPCMGSRKEGTITEDDVACLIDLDPANFTTREYRALRFFEMFANDHHSIDDDTFRWLAEVFSAAEIVEILYACSQNLGGHRMMHALGVLEPTDPILTYSPAAVDAAAATTV